MNEHQLLDGAPDFYVAVQRGPRRRRRSRLRKLAPAAGAIAAVLVAVLVLATLQPSGRSSSAAGSDPQASAPAATVAGTTTSDQEAATKAPILLLYTGNEADAARAREFASFLRERGFTVASVREVRFEIQRTSIRLFARSDQAEGERLVEAMREFFADAPDHVPQHAIDLSSNPGKLETDEIEIWLAAS